MITEKLAKTLNDEGFDIDVMYAGETEVSTYTPAGEDWRFYIQNDADFKSFAENFDPDEEFDALYKSGCRGLPSPSELIQDQLWKKETLTRVKESI